MTQIQFNCGDVSSGRVTSLVWTAVVELHTGAEAPHTCKSEQYREYTTRYSQQSGGKRKRMKVQREEAGSLKKQRSKCESTDL